MYEILYEPKRGIQIYLMKSPTDYDVLVFRPYFYVIGKDPHDLLTYAEDKDFIVEKTDLTPYIFNGYKYVLSNDYKVFRLDVRAPAQVRDVRKDIEKLGYKYSQARVKYAIRTSIDLHKFKSLANSDLEFNEIEEIFLKAYEEAKKIPITVIDTESVRGQLVAIGITNTTIGETEDPEVEILYGEDIKKWKEKVNGYYLVGHNIIGYDFKVLGIKTERSLIVKDKIVPVIDTAILASKFGQSLGLSSTTAIALDEVAHELGLISKEEFELELSSYGGKVEEWYEKNRSLFEKYLTLDVVLTTRIIRKWFPVLWTLWRLTGISISALQWAPTLGAIDEIIISKNIEVLERKIFEERGRIYDYNEELCRIPRKKVFIWKGGVYKNVVELDFHMLYPTIYYTYNVDPTGVILDKKTGYPVRIYDRIDDKIKTFYVKFTGGLIYKIISKIYLLRKLTKKIKSEKGITEPDQVAKILANAVFGILSKKSGGIGLNEIVSGFIFYRSLDTMYTVLNYLASKGYKVLYGDTDSVYITDVSNVEALIDEVNKLVKEVFGSEFELKLEEVWDYLILFGGEEEAKRKNYIKIKGDNIIFKGAVLAGGNYPLFIEKNLEKIIFEILNGREVEDIILDLAQKADVEELFYLKSKKMGDYLKVEEEEEEEYVTRVKRVTKWILIAPLVVYAIENNTKIIRPSENRDLIIFARALPIVRRGKKRLLLYHRGKLILCDTIIEPRDDHYIVFIDKREISLSKDELIQLVMKVIREETWFSYLKELEKYVKGTKYKQITLSSLFNI